MFLLPLDLKFVGWRGLKPSLDGVVTTIDSVLPVTFNIASGVLGIIFIIGLIVNISRQQRGENGSQNAFLGLSVAILGAILLMQLIRVIFFRN